MPRVLIPNATASRPDATSVAPESPTADGKTSEWRDNPICIVDDDSFVCDSLAELLEAHGADPVITARDLTCRFGDFTPVHHVSFTATSRISWPSAGSTCPTKQCGAGC